MDPLIFHFPEVVQDDELLLVREEVVEQDFALEEEIFETPEITDVTYTLQNMLDVGGVGNRHNSTSYDEKEISRYSSEKSDSEEDSEYGEPSWARDLFQYGEHSNSPPSDHEMHLSTGREDSFSCDICFNSFPRKESLNRHKRTHESDIETGGICFVCGMKFNNVNNLKIHEEEHVAERSDASTETWKRDTSAKDESYKCDICNRTFSSKDNLTLHKCVFTNKRTDICNAKENSTTNVFSQECNLMMNKKWRSEKSYYCAICGMKFRQKCFLKYHQLIHTREKPRTCKKCGAAFARRTTLKAHILAHTQGRGVTCEDCKKVFRKSSHLYKHQQISIEEKPYACKKCGAAFARASCLKYHKRDHIEERPFPCNLCKTTVHTADELVAHMHSQNENTSYAFIASSETRHEAREPEHKLHQKVEQQVEPENQQIYCTCGTCGETFASPDGFKNHKCSTNDARKTFKCNVCDKSFSRRSGLASHSRVHSPEKKRRSYTCEECDAAFDSPASLRTHTLAHKKKQLLKPETCRTASPPRSTRTGQTHQNSTKKMHSCTTCSKEFSTKSHLTRHLRTVHANQKGGACQKKSAAVASLRNSEKQSRSCANQTTVRSTTTCTEQRETAAQSSWQAEDNYGCSRCSRIFPRKPSLTKHLQLHTRDNAFSCASCAQAKS